LANYGIIVADDGNGAFYLLAVNRGTTTTSFSGGVDLLTNTYTQTSATGALATASGFLNSTNLTASADSLGRKVKNVLEAAVKAGELCQNDRAFNL